MVISDEFRGFCGNATAAQLENILADEYRASRDDESRLPDYNAAVVEAESRGWTVINGQRI